MPNAGPRQSKIRIDKIDAKILTALVTNPRISIKSMAKDCGISSVAVFKRIKRLKETGVIVGTAVFPAIAASTEARVVTVGLNLKPSAEPEICKLFRERTRLVELSQGIGKYDLCLVILVKNTSELNNLSQAIRRRPGVKRIATNIWTPDPCFCLENMTFQQKGD